MTDSVYQKTVLPNGIRVATEAMPNVRSITVGVWVDVGSRDEEANENGISHLLEHMIFKGTARRTALDIAKELDAIGGMSNAFTCKEQTCFHAKVLDTHLDQVVDLLLEKGPLRPHHDNNVAGGRNPFVGADGLHFVAVLP